MNSSLSRLCVLSLNRFASTSASGCIGGCGIRGSYSRTSISGLRWQHYHHQHHTLWWHWCGLQQWLLRWRLRWRLRWLLWWLSCSCCAAVLRWLCTCVCAVLAVYWLLWQPVLSACRRGCSRCVRWWLRAGLGAVNRSGFASFVQGTVSFG